MLFKKNDRVNQADIILQVIPRGKPTPTQMLYNNNNNSFQHSQPGTAAPITGVYRY